MLLNNSVIRITGKIKRFGLILNDYKLGRYTGHTTRNIFIPELVIYQILLDFDFAYW
jgi:hypothetical protein